MNDRISPAQAGPLSVEEALSKLLAGAKAVTDTELIATHQAWGRVLAESQHSSVNVPPLDNSAMDGYALACADLTSEEGSRLRVSQRIPAGKVGIPLEPGTCARIFTGAPVPPGADAVVMQEDCQVEGEWVSIRSTPIPGQNIRRAGEDIQSGGQVLPAGTIMSPQAMGLAASVGLDRVPVFRRLRVATFFTGDEIVMPGEVLRPGQIYNSNRFTLSGLLASLGCEVIDLGIVPDNLEATVSVLNQAAEGADMVVTSGGVSVGEEDHVKAAVERIGTLEMWRVAAKPGKPLAYGRAGKAAFIGLPGNPVSAFVTFCLFVRPFIRRCQGVAEVSPKIFQVRAEFDWGKPDQRREFVRAKWAPGSDGYGSVALYPNQSSGVLTSTVWADGLIDIPAGKSIKRGELVKFIPFSELGC